MTTTYTVEFNTAEGHQMRRVEADGYIKNMDGSLTLFLNVGEGKQNIALFSADKWICVRDTTPGKTTSELLKDLSIVQAVT